MADDLVLALRKALRATTDGRDWRPTYQDAMETAYRREDYDSVGRLAAAAAAYLDLEGRQREALAEVEFGLLLTAGDPRVHAHMLRIRAWWEIMAGEVERARASLDAAASEEPSETPADVAESHLRNDLLDTLALEEDAQRRVATAIPFVERTGAESLTAFGKLWLGCALAGRGEVENAQPWADSLAAHGAAHSNRWRVAEAEELRRACMATRAAVAPCEHPETPDPAGRGYIAEWLHAGITSYQAVHFREAEGIEPTPAWQWAWTHMPAGYRTAGDGFRAAIVARYEDRWVGQPSPPTVLTLLNAGSALANAEAVAVSGTQALAASWSAWFTAHWPKWMRTTVEWPASALRIQGLIHARAGDLRAAVSLLRQAVAWSEDAGYEVEHAISMVQLAELMALAPGTVPRRTWTTVRTTGRELCRELGVDASGVADAAVSAAALGKFDAQRPQLTPREVEVLDLFRDGLTYKQAGKVLHLDWRTVQTHAKNIYAKLEVTSKTSAVVRATELGLL